MSNNMQSLNVASLPNSTAAVAVILPVDSWPYLEAIADALSKLRRKLAADSEALALLDSAEENLRYLVAEGEKEAENAIAWAASL